MAAEPFRQLLRHLQPRERGVAGAHDRHNRPAVEVEPAEHGDDGRRGIDLREVARKIPLAAREESRAHGPGRRQLRVDARLGCDGDAPAGLAQREVGQLPERFCRAAELIDEALESLRTDAFRTRQPQPVKTLLVAEGRTSADMTALALLADAPLGSGEEAADIGPVHDEDQNGEQQEDAGLETEAARKSATARWRWPRAPTGSSTS